MSEALKFGADAAETLLRIGRAIGFGRAQQILGEQWEAEHDCAPRGRMGVTVQDAEPPAGWKLVPIEPTSEMLLAPGALRFDGRAAAIHRDVWNRMIAAAPPNVTGKEP